MLRKYLPWLIAAGILTGVALGAILNALDGDDEAPPAHTTITVPTPGPDQKVTVDPDNQLDPDEKREARTEDRAEPLDLHEDLRDETPAGVTPEQVEAGREQAERTEAPKLDAPQEPAGAQAYSCPAAHVVNQSSLNGRRYGVALHFTVSQPGSLLGIRNLFNRPSFGASSNYGFELYNLRCQQWVPDNRKAWAQGAFNSAYISIEIISNDRSRASWLATPAFKYGVLAALVRDLLKRTGAPAQRRDPVGCTPLAGIVDHDSLECGNTHWDVGRNFPWDVFIRQVRQGATVQVKSVLTKVERGVANRRCYHRAQRHAGRNVATTTRWERHYLRRVGKLRANLRQLGLTTKHNRKLRHRVLGGYALGKACR